MAERIFDEQETLFMKIYNEITVKPYLYVLVDNKADTAVYRQSVSDVFGACVSYEWTETSRAQTLETLPTEQRTRQDSSTRILQMDERREPLLVHLNETQWSMVKDMFREAQSGGNPPPGWNIWIIYIIDSSGYFLPVPLKHSTSTKTMCCRPVRQLFIQ